MFEFYEERRVDEASADPARNLDRDPMAFLAGVQYAFDQLLTDINFAANHANFGPCMSGEMAEAVAINALEKAKAGEPQ